MKCPIKGVLIKELTVHKDERGWLLEIFRNDELAKLNQPVMAYLSSTKPGIVRGPHEHKKQADLFCFLGFSTFRIYLWDNRKKSSSYKKKFTIDTTQLKPMLISVPPGVVHAYKNTGPTYGLVFNAPNRLYKGKKRALAVDEIRHEDDPKSPFKLKD